MAAPTRVQSTGRIRPTGATSVSLTFATPPTAGNTVVVASIMFNNSGGTFSCADNRGNTYAQAAYQNNGNNVAVVVFACTTALATGSPFTVTITAVSFTTYFEATAIEVAGAGGTGVLTVDRTSTQTSVAASQPATGTTAALTGTDAFLLAIHAIAANQASLTVQVVTPAWFEEMEHLNYSATVAGELDSRSVTGVLGTTQACSWTAATTAGYAAALVAFKGTAPAAVATAQAYVWGPL